MPSRSGTNPNQKSAPRNFCYTINNYPADIEEHHKAFWDSGKAKYIVSSYEEGVEGTPHIQGYAEVEPQLKWGQLKAHPLFARAHIEPRRGTAQQASDYCEKVNDPTYVGPCFKAGVISRQGRRTELDDVAEAVHQGKTVKEIIEEFPREYIKFHKGIEAARRALVAPRDPETPIEVVVYYGPTGLGKTRKAYQDNPGAHIQGPGMDQWWDGYDGQDTVILDEYRGQFPFGKLLSLLDRYPTKVQVKGGTAQMTATRFILTMPEHPKNLYPNLAAEVRDGKMSQLKRRINKIYKFSGSDPADPILRDVTGYPWEI